MITDRQHCARAAWVLYLFGLSTGMLALFAWPATATNVPVPQHVSVDGAETQGTWAERLAFTLRSARETVEAELPNLENANQRAEAWGGLAMLYHAQEMLDEAADAYAAAIAEADDETAWPWYYLMGTVRRDQGDVDGAIAAFEFVLNANAPKSPSVREEESADGAVDEAASGVRMLAAYRLGQARLLAGEVAAATEALELAQALAPDSPAALSALADAASEQGDWARARELLTEAAALAPTAGRVAYKLAQVHRRLGDLAAAETWLEKRNALAAPLDDPLLAEVAARSLSPKFFSKLGERAWQRGDADEAIVAWRRAAELAPEDVSVRLVLAHALAAVAVVEEAEAEARAALDLDPHRAESWYSLAHVLRTANPAQARMAAERALSIQDDERTRALAAALAMADADFGQAGAHYANLIEARSDTAYYRYWLGLAALGQGDCSAGAEALRSALALQGNWGQAHMVLVRADSICGDASARTSALTRARQLANGYDHADAQLTLAFALLANGNEDEAKTVASALSDQPDARLLLEAMAARKLPDRPFAPSSTWWLPSELD